MNRRRFLRISATAFASATLFNPALAKKLKIEKFEWQGNVLGSNISFTILHYSKERAKFIVQKSIEEIKKLEKYFSIYQKDSLINKLNKQGFLENPPSQFQDLIKKSIVAGEKSEGYFDITVGSLWQDYNLDKKGVKYGTYKDIFIEKDKIFFKQKNINITLNGIAQGYITDQVKNIFFANGLKNSLLELGEIYALGNQSSKETGWNIALENGETNKIEKIINLKDRAVASSSNYGGYFSDKKNHIINPFNIKKTNMITVSVIANNATDADYISTAIIAIANKKKAQKIFKNFDIEIIFYTAKNSKSIVSNNI